MRISVKVLSTATFASLTLAAMAPAQNVSLSGGEIRTMDLFDRKVVEITSSADYFAGGNSRNANMILRNFLGDIVLGFEAFSADLTLGGGSSDGDIRLRDDDGTTTTIDLEGRYGLVQLGSPDEDGDLRLWDDDPDNNLSIQLDGATGNVTNQLDGNGLVKAWARINPDGTIASCYKCNASTAETRQIGGGEYEIDFTPLAFDISSRPVLCSNGSTAIISNGYFNVVDYHVFCVARFNDVSSVFVKIVNHDNFARNRAFTVVVF